MTRVTDVHTDCDVVVVVVEVTVEVGAVEEGEG